MLFDTACLLLYSEYNRKLTSADSLVDYIESRLGNMTYMLLNDYEMEQTDLIQYSGRSRSSMLAKPWSLGSITDCSAHFDSSHLLAKHRAYKSDLNDPSVLGFNKKLWYSIY